MHFGIYEIVNLIFLHIPQIFIIYIPKQQLHYILTFKILPSYFNYILIKHFNIKYITFTFI